MPFLNMYHSQSSSNLITLRAHTALFKTLPRGRDTTSHNTETQSGKLYPNRQFSKSFFAIRC